MYARPFGIVTLMLPQSPCLFCRNRTQPTKNPPCYYKGGRAVPADNSCTVRLFSLLRTLGIVIFTTLHISIYRTVCGGESPLTTRAQCGCSRYCLRSVSLHRRGRVSRPGSRSVSLHRRDTRPRVSASNFSLAHSARINCQLFTVPVTPSAVSPVTVTGTIRLCRLSPLAYTFT